MLFCALLLAAPLLPGEERVSLRLETSYLQPQGDASSRGGGAGLSLGYRLTDQVMLVAGGSASLLWSTPAEGGPRERHRLTMVSAGLEAAFADCLACGEEFAPRPVGERFDPHRRQHLVGYSQLLAGVNASLFAS